MEQKKTRQGIVPSHLFFEWIYDAFPHGVIACDRAGNILRINDAGLKLFEIDSPPHWNGISYQQFLHRYQAEDRQQPAPTLEPWLTSLISHKEAAPGTQEELKVLQLPSGRMASFRIGRTPVLDARQQVVGTISVFHDITHLYQKAHHLQCVYQSVLSLAETIAHLPEHLACTFPEKPSLLSPEVLFVAQHLVEVIGDVLDCQHVALQVVEPRTGLLHFVAGRGFTPQQEQERRELSGIFSPSAFVDDTILARLSANQEVLLTPGHRLRHPPGFEAMERNEQLLLIPLLLEGQLTGALVIARIGLDSVYTPGEIEFAKTVAAETTCLIECLRCLYAHTEAKARALVQQELHHHIDAFLNLASHDLNTPLTAIKGNIQLAERRLTRLKFQLAGQSADINEQIEHVQSPLASATESARLQERMIQNMLDDLRIQSDTLELHLKPCDLAALLKEAIAHQQRATPGRMIVLSTQPAGYMVPILADADRIRQVIDGYLANALGYSPLDQPVTVQLTVEDARARVSVHDEGPAIPAEEQGRVWQRFSYARRTGGQSELEMSLKSGFYLCRAFIERHHGNVGVQSGPGRGATFWFTLPLAADAGGEADASPPIRDPAPT